MAEEVGTRPRRGRRREQTALSQEQIVGAALKLLDADGVDTFSMRKLGAEVGAAATAVYWHVATKDDLLELCVDAVYGEFEVPEITEPPQWREAAVATANSLRSLIQRHPWVATTLAEVGLTYIGPNLMAVSDRMLALYRVGGFGVIEADQASKTVVGFVLGVAGNEAATLTRLKRTGQAVEEWTAKSWPAGEAAAQQHPHLRDLYAAYREREPESDADETFRYGLERILDGLELRLRG
ncbi:TetR/AcrR family transcriptional regulator C-terminal domain-containing protein [Kribbella sp. NPDC051770]|uniref:TetR/AcrR family transcriptional regulator n=1 Tax=Kribbella sp. NPDC051770 TaxID=3155413 RepID=UPI0034199760